MLTSNVLRLVARVAAILLLGLSSKGCDQRQPPTQPKTLIIGIVAAL